ncbi:hypothetical protein F5880DRAFT_191286 [Lentinula raphanica]|nr:hypothetical protein F5880DRAFT_191286 [Lentinula raphanica]
MHNHRLSLPILRLSMNNHRRRVFRSLQAQRPRAVPRPVAPTVSLFHVLPFVLPQRGFALVDFSCPIAARTIHLQARQSFQGVDRNQCFGKILAFVSNTSVHGSVLSLDILGRISLDSSLNNVSKCNIRRTGGHRLLLRSSLWSTGDKQKGRAGGHPEHHVGNQGNGVIAKNEASSIHTPFQNPSPVTASHSSAPPPPPPD